MTLPIRKFRRLSLINESPIDYGKCWKHPSSHVAKVQSQRFEIFGAVLNPYPHPIIAREGWPFLALALAAAALATAFFGGWSWPFWIIAIFVLQFFRDPPRMIPQKPNAVLSPADGRIVVVEKAHDPYANREALKISVFMNVFNVHSNRSPVDGKIEKVEEF